MGLDWVELMDRLRVRADKNRLCFGLVLEVGPDEYVLNVGLYGTLFTTRLCVFAGLIASLLKSRENDLCMIC